MNKTFSISEAISFGWNTFRSNWKFWTAVFFLVGAVSAGSGGFNSNLSSNLDKIKDWKAGSAAGAMTALTSKNVLNTQKEVTVQDLKDAVERDATRTNDEVLGTSMSYETSNTVLPAPAYNPKVSNGISAITGGVIVLGVVYAIAFIALFAGLSVLATLVVRMGYMNLAMDAARGKQPYYKTLLSQVSFKKALRLFWASLLVSIMVFIGFLFFVLPGIYLALRFKFVSYLIVDRDLTVGQALSESGRLTKNVKWKLLAFSIVTLLLGMIGGIVGLFTLGAGIVATSITVFLAEAYVYVKLSEQVEDATAPVPQEPVPAATLA